MDLLFEIVKFVFYSGLIVVISKYILVPVLRRFSESLNLKAKTVGNLAGIATSIPELLSTGFAAGAGLIGTSIYNILSSNIINLIQYGLAVLFNKNSKTLKNKALRLDLFLVIITILIPSFLVISKMDLSIRIIPIFLLLFVFFYYLNNYMHKQHFPNQKNEELEEIEEEAKQFKGKKGVMLRYLIYLVLIGILLFVVGNLLSNTLENLALRFSIPEFVLGIALGFMTSLPELITFFEAQRHYRQQENSDLGVIEATNNLLTSNILNLFVIQSIAIILYEIFT